MLALAALGLTACGSVAGGPGGSGPPAARTQDTVATASGSPDGARETPDLAVPAPGPLRGRAVVPHVAVVAHRRLPASLLARVRQAPGTRGAVRLSLASLPVAGRTVTLAAADLSAYRRFVPAPAARSRGVWERAAAGELVLEPTLASALGQPLGGALALGHGAGSVSVRVGALAPMPPSVGGLVNEQVAAALGLPARNAMLVSAEHARLGDVQRVVARLVGDRGEVFPLGASLPPGEAEAPGEDARATGRVGAAVLTGGSVAQAAGAFRYRYFADGTVRPDPAWVAANIRTETVPVLGAVTCHRVMLPRLRWALQEVVRRGLASALDPADFGGCYVPRFIEHDPLEGLSLHTWGIAVDLNVSGNQRGTAGEIDRTVVAVFKKWGFAWGGDWSYTDPMHFELAVLTRPRRAG